MGQLTDRRESTRIKWLETLETWRDHLDAPGSERFWAPGYDDADRERLREIQNSKIAAVTPFLYENSPFDRARFDRLGLSPSDIQNLDDLVKWPVVEKSEMMADVQENPPYGGYTTVDDQLWQRRGWMLFSSSGTTGVPRPFRYTHHDREIWAWSNARALYAMGIRPGDSALICSGYGPHVFAWTAQIGLARMGLPVIPGGGLDAAARFALIERFKPTILICTPSYALHLGRAMEEAGGDPGGSSIRLLFVGGEPAMGIPNTRERLETLWLARLAEFYGCTEAAPAAGGYSCTEVTNGGPAATHFMEDMQYWELVTPDDFEPVPIGERGLTVCTNLASESAPQLRFLVGDYTQLSQDQCACGRHHARAIGGLAGRADDLINLRGIKMYPVQLEQAVREIDGIGDEYEIVLSKDAAGMDVMLVRVEHGDFRNPQSIAEKLQGEIRTQCEIRAGVEVLQPGTLAKTVFKANRIRDCRENGT